MEIIPYMQIDGIPTFRDSEIKGLWEKLEQEGIPRTFSRSSYFKCSEDFLYEMKNHNSLYVVMEEKQLVGVFWLNHFQEKFCQIHYWFYRKWWGQTERLGREIFSAIFSWGVFDGLYGILPKDNSLAVRLAKKCGWKEIGVLPFGFYDEKEKVSKPSVIIYLTKDNLEV